MQSGLDRSGVATSEYTTSAGGGGDGESPKKEYNNRTQLVNQKETISRIGACR
jgi:hypothetical protein